MLQFIYSNLHCPIGTYFQNAYLSTVSSHGNRYILSTVYSVSLHKYPVRSSHIKPSTIEDLVFPFIHFPFPHFCILVINNFRNQVEMFRMLMLKLLLSLLLSNTSVHIAASNIKIYSDSDNISPCQHTFSPLLQPSASKATWIQHTRAGLISYLSVL